jgi:hypothetical protein
VSSASFAYVKQRREANIYQDLPSAYDPVVTHVRATDTRLISTMFCPKIGDGKCVIIPNLPTESHI